MFIKFLLKLYVNSVCGSEVVGLEPFSMLQKGSINQSVGLHPVMSQFGLVVRRSAGKWKDLDSIQKGCGSWTQTCDFVHHFLLKH